MQTLPNIDINIKTGNSLISRYGLAEDLKAVFKQTKYSVVKYKQYHAYKESKSKAEKEQLQAYVNDFKEQPKSIVYQRDSLRKEIQKLRGELLILTTANIDLFGKKRTDKDVAEDIKRIELNM